jgi:hypothetical protein
MPRPSQRVKPVLFAFDETTARARKIDRCSSSRRAPKKTVRFAKSEYRDSATIRKMECADSKLVKSISNWLPLSIRNGVMRDPPPFHFGRAGKHADGQKCKSVAISARRGCLFSMSCVIFSLRIRGDHVPSPRPSTSCLFFLFFAFTAGYE